MSRRRLRVLIAGHTYMVRVNQQKLEALAATGEVEVGILTPIEWPAAELGLARRFERPGAEIRAYPADAWMAGRSGAYFYPRGGVRRALSEFRPDLIHVEQEVFALSAFQLAAAARWRRIPLTVFCWENVDRPLSPPRRATRGFVLETARGIIAGNREAGELLRRWGYSGAVAILPQLGVDPETFAPRARLPSNGGFVVGYVGRLVRAKGVDLILEAARILACRGREVRVRIVGSGPEEGPLRARTDALGIGRLVEWAGAVTHDEVPEAMAAFDALVLPSRTDTLWKEQFGHVLIEAMCMGVCVVGSDSGEIPRVIGIPDLVFRENDSLHLADRLDRLILDHEWRETASRRGMARIREHYTHEKIAERLIGLWAELLGTGGEPARALP